MISPKIFQINGSKLFTSDVPIKGIDYVDVFTSPTGLINTYTKVNKSDYEVINNAVVFQSVPSGAYLRMVVVTYREEATNSPSSLSTVFAYLKEIKVVADNVDKLLEVYNAISLITPEYKEASFTAESQKSYLVNATNSDINISFDEDTQSFIIRDYSDTFGLNDVKVFIGQYEYVLSNTSKYYQFVRHLNTFRVYGALDNLIEVVAIV